MLSARSTQWDPGPRSSWLNLVETYFSKIARTFLKHICVDSKDELKERILQGIAETNAEPVVHRWKNFDFSAQYS